MTLEEMNRLNSHYTKNLNECLEKCVTAARQSDREFFRDHIITFYNLQQEMRKNIENYF